MIFKLYLSAIFFIEIIARLLIAFKLKTFGTKPFLDVLSNPTHDLDGRKFNKFGEINDQVVDGLFRFTTQAAYMGISEKELQQIMAKANKTDVETIKNVYTGPKGFEKSRYRPFVGLSTKPNQILSYAKIDEMGFQGNSEHFRKRLNTKRALIFGGSVAYGMGCTSVKNNLTHKLQEQLNKKEKEANSEFRWEVINLSFIASQSISELNQNLIFSSLYSPDIIIELAGFNDLFFFLRDGKGKLYTYLSQQSVINYLYSPFIIKVVNLMASYSFAITALLKLLEIKSQKQEGGQLYTVW